VSVMPEDLRAELLAAMPKVPEKPAAETVVDIAAGEVEPVDSGLPVYDSTPDPRYAELKHRDLREHLTKWEGLVFNDQRSCLCPVHAETSPSFEVKPWGPNQFWYWFDWHNQGRAGFSGTIIDYYITIKGMDKAEAIRTAMEREGIVEVPATAPAPAIAAVSPVEIVAEVVEPEDEGGLVERDASGVCVRPIPWLWHGVIPTHMSTALTGESGEGKSLVAVAITARITQGKPFPLYDKSLPAIRGQVFYVTSEGVPEMILVPRLIAAGADLSKVTIIEGVFLKKGHFSVLDITRDLPKLERRAADFEDLACVVIDPMASFLPERLNANQQNQVRQAMDQISNLAYKRGIAALTVMHFSKTIGASAKNRTSGSVQFMASVKMSWSVIHREGDPRNMRLLVPQKSNITGAHQSISFSIHPHNIANPADPKSPIETVRISFGELVDEDPEKLISPPIDDNYTAQAREFLTAKLRGQPERYVNELIEEAEKQGIPSWALYKAKGKLGIQHDKEGTFQGRTFWYWPREGGKP